MAAGAVLAALGAREGPHTKPLTHRRLHSTHRLFGRDKQGTWGQLLSLRVLNVQRL